MEYTDDYNLKILEIEELKKAVKIKRLNEDLLEHLTATVSWLIRTCEKNNLSIPNKESISKSITRAYEYLDKIPYADQPKSNSQDSHPRGNRILFWILSSYWLRPKIFSKSRLCSFLVCPSIV